MFNLNHKWIITQIALAVTATSFTACSMKGNLDEMHTDTHKMASTTEDMSKTTSKMAATTDGMAATTDKMSSTTQELADLTTQMKGTTEEMNTKQDQLLTQIDNQRQKGAKDTRDEQLVRLRETKDIVTKFNYAVAYMEAFEFNFWDPTRESLEKRDGLFEDAIKELVKICADFKHNSEVGPAGLGNDKQSLYALAAAMHYRNDNQDTAAEKYKFARKSVLNLIVEGLAAKNMTQAQLDLPENHYKREVLRNEDLAVFLLQLRYNFLAGYTFAKLDNDPNTLQKMGLIVGTALHIKWNPQLDKLNHVETNYAAQILEFSNATRAILMTLKYPTEMAPLMKRIYTQMKWNQGKMVDDVRKSGDFKLADARQRLRTAIDIYLGDGNNVPPLTDDQGGPIPPM